MSDPEKLGDQVLLIWIGEVFYPTPEDFIKEGDGLEHDGSPRGVSRRIKAVPRNFKIGTTWVALAHPKTVPGEDENGQKVMLPGIFQMWRPTFIEYIVTGKETEEELNELEEKGYRLIRVIEYGSQTNLFDETDLD